MKDFFTKPYIYLIIIAIGIGLKFYKLDQKFFWDDEIATILHTSGIPMNTYEAKIPVNTVFNRSYFDKILELNSRHLNIFDQVKGLMMMPQLTPGNYYYLIFWIRLFGDGYMSYRYFSVFIFLLSLPVFFMFTRKLFQSKTAAWIAVSLYAVSPFFHAYSQEARYYILWALFIVAMDYLLLMAAEKQNRLWWGVYVVAGALAIHTTILFSLIFLMHIIYYLRFHRVNWKPFFISLGIIFLCALPWLIFIYINRMTIENSMTWQVARSGHIGIGTILLWQLTDYLGVLFNPEVFHWGNVAFTVALVVAGLLLIVGSIVLIKKASKKQALFVMLATFVGMVVIVSEDAVRNSFTSLLPRYQLLNYIGFILMLAFAGKLLLKKNSVVFGVLFVGLVFGGIASSKAISDNVSFGNRGDSPYHVAEAKNYFSGDQHVLIISDCNLFSGPYAFSMFMSLIHRCKDKNIDLIYAKPDYPDFSKKIDMSKYDAVYAMYLTDGLLKDLKKCFPKDMVLVDDGRLPGKRFPMYQIEPSKKLTKLQLKNK
ncbi:MAG TPA: glycosyltransferase family 39 protein [Sunxiuqinia sp.]|nr:glycosyltransferase family 39 protein [Sunxiuqinia sp.]